MKSCTLLVAATLCLPALANDAIYKWKDAQGVEHYTNDINAVPTNVAVIPTQGGDLSQVAVKPRQAPARRAANEEQALALRKAEAEARRAESEAKAAAVAVEHAEAQAQAHWRALFQAARARIQALESELERERATLAPAALPIQGRFTTYDACLPHGSCAVAVADPVYTRAVVRVGQLERELKAAREEYLDLERRASHAAVPRHWRN